MSRVKHRGAGKSNNDYNGHKKRGKEEKREEGREPIAKEAHHFYILSERSASFNLMFVLCTCVYLNKQCMHTTTKNVLNF